MKIEETQEVFQTSIYTEANMKLKEGFKLYKIFNCRTKSQEVESTMPMYVMIKN